MKILLVNRWYPPYTGYGGVATYNYYLANGLRKGGHQVMVLAARWKRSDPQIQDDEGVQVVRILAEHHPILHRLPVIGRFMRPIFQLGYSVRASQKIVELQRENIFDIIEFAEVNAEGFWHLRFRKKNSPRVIVRCHTPTFILREYALPAEMNYDTNLTERMEKYCIRHADALSSPSSDTAVLIENSCGLPNYSIKVIPNLLNIEVFQREPSGSDNQSGFSTILHVGRLDRVKGIEILLHAIPGVLRQCPKTRFILAGGGPVEYLNFLQKLSHQIGIPPENISFLGEISPTNLVELYKKVDIAVVPTLNYESFSYTVAQSMAAGLPVVASRIGGIPETVGKDGAALLVEPGNVEQLIQALISVCKNPELRQKMGADGLLRAKSYFSDQNVIKKMVNFYQLAEN